MITVRHLKKVFKDQSKELTVLSDVNCEIRKGEVISIIGPSGTGKSTFLRCLNRLEEATAGQIEIDGIDILDRRTDVSMLRRKMGMVFQNFNLFEHLTILDNVTLCPMTLLGQSQADAEKRGMELLEMVVEDGRLFIGNKNNVSVSNGKMRIVLHSHSISRFDVFGACDLDSDCMTTDGDFELSISGAGDVEIDKMEAASLKVYVKGAGDISIPDVACAGNISVDILGAGDITLGGYCNDANVSITGGGDIDIRSLDIRGQFTKHVAGGGDIRR